MHRFRRVSDTLANRFTRLALQRPRRWLLFDFDDKRLARAFAHSAR